MKYLYHSRTPSLVSRFGEGTAIRAHVLHEPGTNSISILHGPAGIRPEP